MVPGHIPLASELAPDPVSQCLRGELDTILATVLQRDRRRPYLGAAPLREELLRYLNHEPLTARQGGGGNAEISAECPGW
jgi:hypothetical protein